MVKLLLGGAWFLSFGSSAGSSLSSDEQVAFVKKLWDRIAENPEQVQIPEGHKRIIDRLRTLRCRATAPNGVLSTKGRKRR